MQLNILSCILNTILTSFFVSIMGSTASLRSSVSSASSWRSSTSSSIVAILTFLDALPTCPSWASKPLGICKPMSPPIWRLSIRKVKKSFAHPDLTVKLPFSSPCGVMHCSQSYIPSTFGYLSNNQTVALQRCQAQRLMLQRRDDCKEKSNTAFWMPYQVLLHLGQIGYDSGRCQHLYPITCAVCTALKAWSTPPHINIKGHITDPKTPRQILPFKLLSIIKNAPPRCFCGFCRYLQCITSNT